MEKYSKQKQEIYNFIKSAKNHPTAEEIYLNLNKDKSNVSRGTVYRNLNIMVEKSMVKRISVPNFPDRFDFVQEPHNYAICKSCGKVFDFYYELDETFKDKILNETDLIDFSSEFTIYGICNLCNENK